MDVKSTVTLTREEAEAKFMRIYTKISQDYMREQVLILKNDDLERMLENLNDIANNGEGFENYIIEG